MPDLPPLRIDQLSRIDLRHLFVLTDETGMLQHATLGTPDLYHGYCTDDNARALMLAVNLLSLPQELWSDGQTHWPGREDVVRAMQRYLAFLHFAFNPKRKRFRNFMQYDRSWLEEVGSEDSHARTVWALGSVCRFPPNADVRQFAEQLLERSIPGVEGLGHLRPWAYSMIGLNEYIRSDSARTFANDLHVRMAERMHKTWLDEARADWPWWEDNLTWGNAKLPHAMLTAGLWLGRQEMVDHALEALAWLLRVQTGDEGQLSIVGNRGWYYRGRERARFDQQPIEAKALVQACLAAAHATGEARWADEACRCFEWFLGRNDVGQPVYNGQSGGGYDGLGPDGVNSNQGAESTLAYLVSLAELHLYRQQQADQVALRKTP